MRALICGPEMREVSREPDGTRWCFTCRQRREFEYVTSQTVEISYYEPYARIECGTCHSRDADLGFGRFRGCL